MPGTLVQTIFAGPLAQFEDGHPSLINVSQATQPGNMISIRVFSQMLFQGALIGFPLTVTDSAGNSNYVVDASVVTSSGLLQQITAKNAAPIVSGGYISIGARPAGDLINAVQYAVVIEEWAGINALDVSFGTTGVPLVDPLPQIVTKQANSELLLVSVGTANVDLPSTLTVGSGWTALEAARGENSLNTQLHLVINGEYKNTSTVGIQNVTGSTDDDGLSNGWLVCAYYFATPSTQPQALQSSYVNTELDKKVSVDVNGLVASDNYLAVMISNVLGILTPVPSTPVAADATGHATFVFQPRIQNPAQNIQTSVFVFSLSSGSTPALVGQGTVTLTIP